MTRAHAESGAHGDDPDFVAVRSAVFSPDECERIVSHIASLGQRPGTIGDKHGNGVALDLEIRRVRQTTLHRSTETQWIYDRLMRVLVDCNAAHFRFDVDEPEDLSIVDYREGDFYNWHLDIGRNAETRKLSISVALSRPDDYEGGALSFPGAELGELPQGTAVVFASFLLHGVQPVTRGRRIALVGWLGGPPFR